MFMTYSFRVVSHTPALFGYMGLLFVIVCYCNV